VELASTRGSGVPLVRDDLIVARKWPTNPDRESAPDLTVRG
jgi:hypothetical protein